MNEKLVMGIMGTKLNEMDFSKFTIEELSKIINSCVIELNAREEDNKKIDVNVGDCFINNRKDWRKEIYIIKEVDKRKHYTTISGICYTIEYDNLDIVGGEPFLLKTDNIKHLEKMENFDGNAFELEIKNINSLLINQWNEYIDGLRERTGIELKWNKLYKN